MQTQSNDGRSPRSGRTIRLNDAEFSLIEDAARQMGLSTPSYIRVVSLQAARREVPQSEIYGEKESPHV